LWTGPKFLQLDELKAFRREIDDDVVFVRADFIAGLEKYGGFAAALASKDNVKITDYSEAELLGFEEVGIKLGGLIFRSRVTAIDGVEVSTSHGPDVHVRALSFSHGVPKIAHPRVEVGRNAPACGKFIKIKGKSHRILGE